MNLAKLASILVLALSPFSTAFAGEGTVGGGGGSLNPGQPVSVEVVKDYLGKAQAPVALVYKYMSVAYWNDEGYFGTFRRTDIGRLLYSKQPDIFAKIRAVKVDIVTDGSCLIDGASKDGAAYTNPDRICIDAARIAANPKVGTLNIFVTTLALVAHEYSHLVGTNEEQAKVIQDHILTDVSESMKEQYPKWIDSFKREIDYSLQIIQMTKADLRQTIDWSQVCFDVAQTYHAVWAASNAADNQGYNGRGLLSRAEWNKALPQLYAMSSLAFACKNDAAAAETRRRVFGSANQIPVMEYLKRMNPEATGNIDVQGSVRRLDYHDAETLLKDLNDLEAMVQYLKSRAVPARN